MYITELGKEIINSKVGLYLNDKIIPQNSKGEVIELNHSERLIRLKWNVDGKYVSTNIEMKLYDDLKKSGIIDYLENHIDIPASLFEPGEMVEGDCTKGIIKRKEYSGIDKTWWYDVLSANGVLDEDHEIRYEREEEKYLKKVTSLTGKCNFKGQDFTIILTKTDSEEK